MFRAQSYWLLMGLFVMVINVLDRTGTVELIVSNDLYTITSVLFFGFSIEAGIAKDRERKFRIEGW